MIIRISVFFIGNDMVSLKGLPEIQNPDQGMEKNKPLPYLPTYHPLVRNLNFWKALVFCLKKTTFWALKISLPTIPWSVF